MTIPQYDHSQLNLEILDLSARTHNCLKRANVDSITDLFALPVESIAAIRNLGKKSLAELCAKLKEYASQFSLDSGEDSHVFSRASVTNLALSSFMETRLTSAGISTLGELAATPYSQLSDVLTPKEASALLAKMSAYIIVRSTYPDQIGEILPTMEQKSLAVEAQPEPARTQLRIRSDIDLSSLELSVRPYNALRRAGIKTLGQLMLLSQEEIADIRHIGRKALAEIGELIEHYGHLVQIEREGAQVTLDTNSIDALDLPEQAKTKLKQTGIETLEELAALSCERLLAEVGLWLGDIQIIEQALAKKNLALVVEEARYPMGDQDLMAIAKRKKIPLDQIPVERLALPEKWKILLVPANITTIGQLCQASEVVLQELYFPKTSQTVAEIRLRLNAYLAWLTEQDFWETEILQQGISPVYLIELSQTSLDEMLDRLLNSLDTDRQRETIRLRWGLGTTEPRTLEEVGQLYSLTRERIRQIERQAMLLLHHPLRKRLVRLLLDFLRETLVQAGGVASTDYLAETLEDRVASATIDSRNAVRFLCSIHSQFIEVKKEDAWGLEGYPLKHVRKINRLMVKILANKYAPMSRGEILAEFKTAELYKELQEDVTDEFLNACIHSNPQVEISDDGHCALIKWATTRLDKMVLALRGIGKPEHYTEITRKTNELLPKDQRASAHNIHAHMGRLPDIFVRCGRGIFGLAEWGLHQDDCLADAACRVLTEASRPLHVEAIIDRVLQTWQAERESVYAAIQNDERFYRVGKGMYWLTDRIGQVRNKGRGCSFSEVYGEYLLERQKEHEGREGSTQHDTHGEVEKIKRLGLDLFG
jgi:DNA-directed RNA polymerase alpha subunit